MVSCICSAALPCSYLGTEYQYKYNGISDDHRIDLGFRCHILVDKYDMISYSYQQSFYMH